VIPLAPGLETGRALFHVERILGVPDFGQAAIGFL
jgi:hypothetical protein